MEYYFCNNNYGGELMKFDSTEQWKSKVKRVIISQEEIRARLKDAGAYIDSIYDGSPILLVSILKGAFVFMADLCREVTVPCEIEFMAAKMADGGRRVRINRLISAAQVRGFDIQRNWASAIGRTLAVERGIAVAQRPTVFDVMIVED